VTVTAVDLGQLLGSFRESAFRLETLDHYTSPAEVAWLEAFRRDGSLPHLTPDNDPWVKLVTDAIATGRRMRRVHILSRPLSPYLQFQLAMYGITSAAGEDIRIADRQEHPQLAALGPDFWLFDDTTVAVMHYDAEGRLLGVELADDPAPYQAQRDLAIVRSVTLAQYLALSGKR
jgi:hypothetical protein